MSKNKKIIIHNGVGIIIALGLCVQVYSMMICHVLLLIWLIFLIIIAASKDQGKSHGNCGKRIPMFLFFGVLIAIALIFRSAKIFLMSFMILFLTLNLYRMRIDHQNMK